MDPALLAILVGGSGAILAIARGLKEWLSRKSETKITIRMADGTSLLMSGITVGDANKIIQTFTRNLEAKESGAQKADKESLVVSSTSPPNEGAS